jgi:hypothetical protein
LRTVIASPACVVNRKKENLFAGQLLDSGLRARAERAVCFERARPNEMTLLTGRKHASSATRRTTASQQPPALGCTPSFRDLQRTCIYLEDQVEAAACSAHAQQVTLEERTRQVERAAVEMDAMRLEAEMEREAAAAWRAERQSLLRLHAVRAEEVATARRGHEAVESQLLAVESVQLEQHMLLLAQERQLKDERAARAADAVGMRGLQREVRSLEAQLERAASEQALQRQHIAALQQTYMYALGGVAVPRVPQRAANAEAPCRARAEVRTASPIVHAGGASLAPAIEVPETAPRRVGGEYQLPTEVLGREVLGREDLLMMWSNPEGW